MNLSLGSLDRCLLLGSFAWIFHLDLWPGIFSVCVFRVILRSLAGNLLLGLSYGLLTGNSLFESFCMDASSRSLARKVLHAMGALATALEVSFGIFGSRTFASLALVL